MSNTESNVNELMKNKVIKLIDDMGRELQTSAQESVKFIQGNSSAGTRVRKAMQNVKNLAQEVRVEVQAQKNGVPA